MRKNILAFVAVLFIAFGATAQIDRSKQPQPGPAPKINVGKPETFTLDNGLKVMVVENHKLPRVSMSLSLDNPPHPEGSKAGVSSLMGAVLGAGSNNIPKDEFNEEVDYLGASLNFYSAGASANTLSKYFPRVLELMAEGAINPKFTQEEFDKEKQRLIENLKSNQKDVAFNARRVRSALAYGKNHPYGEFATEESIEQLNLENVKAYYNTYFVPQNAYLVIVGDVDPAETKKLVEENFSNWDKKNLPSFKLPEVTNAQYTQINFIDMPNAVQSEIAVVNTIKLQKGDEDYFPVLLANKILGGGGEARLFLNLREDKGYTYGAYSSTGDDKIASTFVASASVRNAVTDSAIVAFLDEIHRIRDEKVTPQELNNAKNKYTGDFVLSLEQPSTIAKFALNIETEDLSDDFYETFLEKIKAVTLEDVQRVAQNYFKIDKARIVVAGKGSEVAEDLENMTYNGKNIPVRYFDRFGNETEKPEAKKMDASMSVKKVFENYIEAIGGREAVNDIESVVLLAQAEVQGMQLDLNLKRTSDGKLNQTISMNGNVMSKQVFNGEEGYVMAQGQKIPYTEDQIKIAKADANPFPELNTENASLEGIEEVNGSDAYVVAFDANNKSFYDTETGLKVQSSKTMSQGGQTMTITTGYNNYEATEGVKFPHQLSMNMGPQNLEFNVSEVLVNEGVSETDFEL
ncbi:M16 family metallopeptidase [Salegentibacter chungangensis]|uniref:M16 family metallopeptidase n=1 Tax=Salegentibacter chungangensis TaxID=1335724 RepID=A0ABW3NMA5_9FLAO